MVGNEKRISLITGGLLGAFTGLTVVGLTYLAERFIGLPFVPFDLFDWMARNLPGGLITFVIDMMVMVIAELNLGSTSVVGKLVEQSIAIVQFILLGALFGVFLAAVGRRRPKRLILIGASAMMILLVPVILIEFSLGLPAAGAVGMILGLAVVFLLWGVVLARLILETAPQARTPSDTALSRRQFLYLVGAGSFTVLVSALGVTVLLGQRRRTNGEKADMEEMLAASNTSGPAASPPQEELQARSEPVTGTRPELTSNENFYRIDINTRPPEIDGERWQLEIGGLVFQPLSLSLENMRAFPSVSQVITLSCISNRVGGDLISTSLWTGVRLKEVLEEAGLRRGVAEIAMEAEDGFYESMPLEEAMDERTLLVYEMNGEPLPEEHGYPLRVFIPNHYGMKQPKWITKIEAIDHEGAGYWVDRGWSEEAIPKTTSVVDSVAVGEQASESRIIPVGGLAYAGARGISKVEVQVDDGPWEAAELRTPPLSPLTWVQWRYQWQSELGRHTFRVRAYDGKGDLQATEPTEPHPDGASGIHSVTESVRGQ